MIELHLGCVAQSLHVMQCVRLVVGGATLGIGRAECPQLVVIEAVERGGRPVPAVRVDVERDLEALRLERRGGLSESVPLKMYEVARMHSQFATEQPAGLCEL